LVDGDFDDQNRNLIPLDPMDVDDDAVENFHFEYDEISLLENWT
jgi:hypothetical protein